MLETALFSSRTELPTPQEVHEPLRVPPTGSALARGLRALLSGRLPYAIQCRLEVLQSRVGFRTKSMNVDGDRVLVRRASVDEQIVRCVMLDLDYTRGWEPIGKADTVIDIWGNIGAFALIASRAAPDGHVFTFEPETDNFRLLKRNIAANGRRNVTAVHAAVAAKSGVVRLFKATKGSLHTTVEGRLDASGLEETRAVSLADIMDSHGIDRVDFLKIDCEGAEYEILYGLPSDYFPRIQRIALEYHARENKRARARELAGFLLAQGFELVEFTDFVGHDAGFLRVRRAASPSPTGDQ